MLVLSTKKFYTIVLLLLVGIATASYLHYKNPTTSLVCTSLHPKYSEQYCAHIGKQAQTLYTEDTPIVLGTIISLHWVEKGAIISQPKHAKRTAPKSGYYYRISSEKSDYEFLRHVDDINKAH
jgi:hypothetical protein